MSPFTIIGFWPASMQRFCTSLRAPSAAEAEALCMATHPELAVCGVIAGEHLALDRDDCVAFPAP